MRSKDNRRLYALERESGELKRALSTIVKHTDAARKEITSNNQNKAKYHLLMIEIAVRTIDPALLPSYGKTA
jgi:hypothetical protein